MESERGRDAVPMGRILEHAHSLTDSFNLAMHPTA
jgi:hypothetical protein